MTVTDRNIAMMIGEKSMTELVMTVKQLVWMAGERTYAFGANYLTNNRHGQVLVQWRGLDNKEVIVNIHVHVHRGLCYQMAWPA